MLERSWTPALDSSARMQDGKPHFASSEEAEYSRLLCDRVSAIICDRSQVPVIASPQPKQSQAMAAQVQRQPRGNRMPPLVPERSQVVSMVISCADGCLTAEWRDFPAGSVLLRQVFEKGEKGSQFSYNEGPSSSSSGPSSSSPAGAFY